jgi:uncharacterized protein (DUF58 family)
VTQLREFHEGDEKRQIHWKQTARQQQLIVVDRQRQADTPVFLVLDPRVADTTDPEVLARFEQVVSEAATAVVRRLKRGQTVGLVVGAQPHGPVHDPAMAGLLMRPLAEVEPLPAQAPEPPLVGDGATAFRVAEAP